MREKKQLIHTAQLFWDGQKLCFRNKKQKEQFAEFQKGLSAGVSVEMVYAAAVEEGTLNQLRKIHAAIRVLAGEIGCSELEMKIVVKKHGGYFSGEVLDSFGDYDLARLNAVFQTICEIGDTVGVNCR